MAKATSCKEAIANFEKAKGVVAAETDKVRLDMACVATPEQLRLLSVTDGLFWQVLLYGQVPPIDKMDASLSSLKACK